MDESHRLQARATSDLGDRPLRVISVAKPGQRREEQDIAMEFPVDLVRLSTAVIVDHRRDSLLLFQVPRAVIDSIHEVADDIRHHATLSGHTYGVGLRQFRLFSSGRQLLRSALSKRGFAPLSKVVLPYV